MYPFRFIVAVDVDAASLPEAYKKLRTQLDKATSKSHRGEIGWETTDEAFDSQGNRIDPDELQDVISSSIDSMIADGTIQE